MTRAGNLCHSSAGAVLALATSGDGGHPAQHIIDGNLDTFWTTTGMFPQEFIISLNTLQKIGKITLESSQIRSLRIETSTSKEPTNFEHCVEREFEHVEGQFHNEEITIPWLSNVIAENLCTRITPPEPENHQIVPADPGNYITQCICIEEDFGAQIKLSKLLYKDKNFPLPTLTTSVPPPAKPQYSLNHVSGLKAEGDPDT